MDELRQRIFNRLKYDTDNGKSTPIIFQNIMEEIAETHVLVPKGEYEELKRKEERLNYYHDNAGNYSDDHNW